MLDEGIRVRGRRHQRRRLDPSWTVVLKSWRDFWRWLTTFNVQWRRSGRVIHDHVENQIIRASFQPQVVAPIIATAEFRRPDKYANGGGFATFGVGAPAVLAVPGFIEEPARAAN